MHWARATLALASVFHQYQLLIECLSLTLKDKLLRLERTHLEWQSRESEVKRERSAKTIDYKGENIEIIKRAW